MNENRLNVLQLTARASCYKRPIGIVFLLEILPLKPKRHDGLGNEVDAERKEEPKTKGRQKNMSNEEPDEAKDEGKHPRL